jgi:hypothetical protein
VSLPPWLAPVADALTPRIAAATLPHALLITGPPGWGDDLLANWLALTLLNVAPDRDAAQLAHPDLRWVVAEGAVIKVDMVREINDFAHGTAQAGHRKVAVLLDADALNVNAANALLKTLEEPPAGTHLLLASSRPGRLLPTIRSRCQAVTITPDAALARAWLEAQGLGADLDQRLFEHGGAPLDVIAAAAEPPLAQLLLDALGGGRQAALTALMKADLVSCLGRWSRYVAALAAGAWQPPALAHVSGRVVAEFAAELAWARRQLLSSNSANPRLLAERLVACWRRLGNGR